MKDNFSSRSDQYARYRPEYPQALFDFLNTLENEKGNAWDCGTGNGQVAAELANSFARVFASDLSQNQLQNAIQKPNITYSVQPAEKTSFPDSFFDLIIVAQAIHWFDFEAFYREAMRTARENAHLVVTGYGLIRVSETVDAVIGSFYENTIGPFWDKERKYIDESYLTIPFPFEEITAPSFSNEMEWTLEHLIGYLGTWSAVKHYEKKKGENPLGLIRDDLKKAWNSAGTQKVSFPILLRIGKINRTAQSR